MKKHFLWASLLWLASSAHAQFESAYKMINAEVQQNGQAYPLLKKATEEIGHRLTGSPNGAKAEEFAYQLFKSFGYQVNYQPFEVESWSRESLSVQIGEANQLKMVKSVSLAHSPVKADIIGDIVDVGNGLEADYADKKEMVKGKIALIYLGVLPGSPKGTPSLHRSEKTAIAINHGAKGVIIINTVKDGVLLTGTASVTGKLIPIPAICIGLEDGMALKEALKVKPQQAQIAMRNFSGKIKARNVVATLKGSSLPHEKIVVGGHLDSWDLATGAIDNGIGSFAVIDMARTLKKLNLAGKRSIEFVMFMGEEQGLLGSKAYVEQAQKDKSIDQIRYMLNFDMTNDPKGFSTSRAEMESLFKAWGGDITKIDTGFKNSFHAGAGLHSDHQPFMLAGIPTGGGAGGRLPNNAGPYYHSDGDSFKLVDEQGIKNTTRYGAMLAYSLANVTEIPVKRMDEVTLEAFLIKNNLKLPLQISGDWRWGN
ncbi:MAG: M28 family peptidase [Pedobacter sp.]|nr:MAG: M28 family peptidase [Pedobacter sp.]